MEARHRRPSERRETMMADDGLSTRSQEHHGERKPSMMGLVKGLYSSSDVVLLLHHANMTLIHLELD